MSQIPRKLDGIRKTSQKQYSKWSRHMRIALVCLIFSFVFVASYTYAVQGKPITELQTSYAIFGVVMMALTVVSLLAFGFLIGKSKPISYEKRLFLRILRAYEGIDTYIALSESPSQERESNLQEAEELLEKVSEELLANKTDITTFDLIREANSKYAKIGELLQAKILFYLRNKKEMSMIKGKILLLANAFAEASSNHLDSCITSINSILGEGEFKLKPSRTETFLTSVRNSKIGRSLISLFLGFAVILVICFVYALGTNQDFITFLRDRPDIVIMGGLIASGVTILGLSPPDWKRGSHRT